MLAEIERLFNFSDDRWSNLVEDDRSKSTRTRSMNIAHIGCLQAIDQIQQLHVARISRQWPSPRHDRDCRQPRAIGRFDALAIGRLELPPFCTARLKLVVVRSPLARAVARRLLAVTRQPYCLSLILPPSHSTAPPAAGCRDRCSLSSPPPPSRLSLHTRAACDRRHRSIVTHRRRHLHLALGLPQTHINQRFYL